MHLQLRTDSQSERCIVKAEFELSDFYKEIIEEELNVKEVEFTDDVRAFTSYSFKPQLRDSWT